jgi:hypothetical protein
MLQRNAVLKRFSKSKNFNNGGKLRVSVPFRRKSSKRDLQNGLRKPQVAVETKRVAVVVRVPQQMPSPRKVERTRRIRRVVKHMKVKVERRPLLSPDQQRFRPLSHKRRLLPPFLKRRLEVTMIAGGAEAEVVIVADEAVVQREVQDHQARPEMFNRRLLLQLSRCSVHQLNV